MFRCLVPIKQEIVSKIRKQYEEIKSRDNQIIESDLIAKSIANLITNTFRYVCLLISSQCCFKYVPSRISLCSFFYTDETNSNQIYIEVDINKFVLLFTDCAKTYCYHLSYFPSARLYDGPCKINLLRALITSLNQNEVNNRYREIVAC